MNHCFQAKEKQIKDNQCSKLGLCIVPLPLSLLVSPGNPPRLSSWPSHLEYWCQLPSQVLNGAPSMMEGLGSYKPSSRTWDFRTVRNKVRGTEVYEQNSSDKGSRTPLRSDFMETNPSKWLKWLTFLLCVFYHDKRKMYVLNK